MTATADRRRLGLAAVAFAAFTAIAAFGAGAAHAAGILTAVGSAHQPIRLQDHDVKVVIDNEQVKSGRRIHDRNGEMTALAVTTANVHAPESHICKAYAIAGQQRQCKTSMHGMRRAAMKCGGGSIARCAAKRHNVRIRTCNAPCDGGCAR